MGKVINVFTLIIVIVTAIRVIKTIRSSTLPDAASLHRRQENKLTWLTYNISGVCRMLGATVYLRWFVSFRL